MTWQGLILRAASLLVPSNRRGEWLAEWQSELCYVNRRRTSFCFGSFADALWLRRHAPHLGFFRFESPGHCLLSLSAVAALACVVAYLTPATREWIGPGPNADTPELVQISGHHNTDVLAPSISVEEYRTWLHRAQHRFAALAFYQPRRVRLSIGKHPVDVWIARAEGRLFEHLKLPLVPGRTSLLVSRSSWRKYFRGSPPIGRTFEIDGQSAVLAGIVDSGSWRLPRMDAWLIESESSPGPPSGTQGFVLAQMRVPTAHVQGRWHMLLPEAAGGIMDFDCYSLGDTRENPLGALIAMSVVTWFVMRMTNSSRTVSGMRSLRQWSFFIAKAALIVPIAILGSLDVTSLIASVTTIHLEPLALIAAWILSVRWAVRDQQQRCPVCLRLLVNPVPIGQASQTFLGWYGTEFMCSKGHGMLHLAELPSNSCSASRWIRLDPSWSGLF
jgi:hypothetical protein